MPVLFTCPHCKSKTLVEPEFLGHAGACADCGKPITVPALQEDGRAVLAASQGTTRTKRLRWIGITCVVVLSLIGATALLVRYGDEGYSQVRANIVRGGCRNNARLIAQALNAYADDYKTYPPPIVTDSKGKPLYSWRVLLLPYLQQQALYDKFALAEPWDSETNHPLAYSIPSVYSSPASSGWGEYSYGLITGPGTLFPQSGPLGPDDISDPLQLTLLVVEMARPPNSQQVWTQPGDLDFSAMVPAIGMQPGVEIGGNHKGGAVAATCDGRDHFLPDSLSASEIAALITPNGGEPLRDDLLDAWD